MYSYVARQPIVDRNRRIVGFELLYRDGNQNAFPQVDADYATRSVLIEQFLVHQYRILDGKVGFINFGYESLLSRIPFDFPREHYTIEILENCPPSDELYDLIVELKTQGYRIALDDFMPSNKWVRFFPYIDLIKFDIQGCPIPKAALFFKKLSDYNIEFLAEKVETYQEFELAKSHGFHYFQGYFFSKPELVQNKKMASSIEVNIRLSKAILSEPLDLQLIEDIVASNTALSYKLLSFVNTCSQISAPIQSLQQALVYLGEERIRKFVSYAVIMALNPEKPSILFSLSLQRARFIELILQQLGDDKRSKQGYLCGMLSLLDAVLDVDMERLITPLNIETDIKQALIERQGVLGEVVRLVEALEASDWGEIATFEKRFGLNEPVLIDCYVASSLWAAEVSN